MSDPEELKRRNQNLSACELAKFRAWFIQFDQLIWDKQIEAHSKAGELDSLISEALGDYRVGKARET